MTRLFRQLDRLFNRLLTSRYNPIMASGSIALGLFAIVLLTGLYLIFFYQLGAPYESVKALHADPWLGSWIRSTHRYASDLMAIAVIFHVLRLIIQGKTWGPRTLAWLTGVGLLLLMLVSAWTGYVMVWDSQAQLIAVAGAKIFDALGLFPDPILRSFSGIQDAPPSFFFLNLFLHVAIPLGMIFGVWVHTAHLARADWLPNRRILLGMFLTLVLVSVIWPASLGEKASLLTLPQSVPLDLIFNFWTPWTEDAPLLVFWGVCLLGVLLCLTPWLTKPRLRPPLSGNDPEICRGCSQCVQDCPYEAIQMVSMEVRSNFKTVAQVSPELCVSCGLCSASCEPMTIGPEGRKAGNQVRAARAYLAGLKAGASEQMLVIGCRHQGGVLKSLGQQAQGRSELQLYPVDCPGTLHSFVYDLLAEQFAHVLIVACPSRNCTNKDGPLLLRERLSGLRSPSLSSRLIQERISVIEVGEGEEDALLSNWQAGEKPSRAKGVGLFLRRFKTASTSFVLTLLVAFLSQIPLSTNVDQSLLRISLRLVGQSEKICRNANEQELAKLSKHMRVSQVCDTRPLSYQLKLRLDGREVLSETVHPGGFKMDRPLYVSQEISLRPGTHLVELSMLPQDVGTAQVLSLNFNQKVEFKAGRVVLIHFSPEQKDLVLKGESL